LKEAPYAYGSTWEAEKDLSEQQWRGLVQSRTRFVAEAGDQVVGTAAAGASTYRRTASMTSLWVDPHWRGKGVGDLLVTAVTAWAAEFRYNQLLLWVTDGNTHAERLYERHGFRRTGDTSQVRPGESRIEFEMSVRLT